jgi:hypothetical protein
MLLGGDVKPLFCLFGQPLLELEILIDLGLDKLSFGQFAS